MEAQIADRIAVRQGGGEVWRKDFLAAAARKDPETIEDAMRKGLETIVDEARRDREETTGGAVAQ